MRAIAFRPGFFFSLILISYLIHLSKIIKWFVDNSDIAILFGLVKAYVRDYILHTVCCSETWSLGHNVTRLLFQWDLVCDKSYQAQLTQTVLVIGQGIWGYIFHLSGRPIWTKEAVLNQSVDYAVRHCRNSICSNILVFTLIRFVLGAVQQVNLVKILTKFYRCVNCRLLLSNICSEIGYINSSS